MKILFVSVFLSLEMMTVSGDVREMDEMADKMEKLDCKAIVDMVSRECMMRCREVQGEKQRCEDACRQEIKNIEETCSEGKKASEKIKKMSPREKEELLRQEKAGR